MPYFRRAIRSPDQPDDAALLAAFTVGGDAEAFALLVRRHGPMVYGVCRRWLREEMDIEDAFQATFLVLVRRAGAIEQPKLLANWLYGVALRAARKLRDHSQRLRYFEGARPDLTRFAARPSQDPELAELLDDELRRLPEKYRVPIILCHLQGLTRREAAGRLGCPEGTLSVRLARALTLLRHRLTRRGLSLPTAALAAALTSESEAAVPRLLIRCTIQTAWQFLMRPNLPIPGRVTAIAQGVMQMFLLKRLVAASAVVLMVIAVGLAGTMLIRHVGDSMAVAADPPATKPATPPLKLSVEIGKNMAIYRLTLREGDDEVEMKTTSALNRYLRRVRLDRTASSELIISAPAEMKYSDLVEVLSACEKAGFGRLTVERANTDSDALARKQERLRLQIDGPIERQYLEDAWQKYFSLKTDAGSKLMLDEAKRFYEKAIEQAKTADAAGQERDAAKLEEAKRLYEKALEQAKVADAAGREHAAELEVAKRFYERATKADLEGYYDLLDRKKAVEALKDAPQLERDRQQIQGRWRAALILEDGKPVQDEAALKRFEWRIVGEYFITTIDGSPRVGSIQVIDGKGSPPGLRFNYDRGAESFSARYKLDGDMLTVIVSGKDPGKESVVVFKRVEPEKK